MTEISRDPMKPADALALVGLADRMEHFPAELSGGEQQRVAIARAIAKRPEVLLCDEPTGALDSSTGIRVLEALSSVNEELGTTTAIITHNAAIHAIADRVVYLADQRISETRVNEERLEPSIFTLRPTVCASSTSSSCAMSVACVPRRSRPRLWSSLSRRP